MNTEINENILNEFRTIESKEPEWLYSIRKRSWQTYNDMHLPERVVHLWKYTDPQNFMITRPQDLMTVRQPHTNESVEMQIQALSDLSAYGFNRSNLVTLAFLHPDLEHSGIIFKNLHLAVNENAEIVGEHLGQLVGSEFGKFEAINLALWNTGLFMYIPDNTVLENPIRLQRHPAGPYTLHRLLVVMGRNSQATIIDDYSGECRREDSLVNSVAEIFVGDASQAKYINIQRQAESCKAYITQRADLGRDAQIYSVFAGLGSNISKVNAGSVLSGIGADSRMYGIAFGNNDQHFDYHTVHHHRASQSHSKIDFKIALKDTANSAYTGLIKIDEDALNCEAYQENRNLLLNTGPKAETIPELEILCDQVQCSHGATVGPIDPEALFYLQSRGLNRTEATRTIVSGFIEPTINQLPDNMKNIARDLIMEKLER